MERRQSHGPGNTTVLCDRGPTWGRQGEDNLRDTGDLGCEENAAIGASRNRSTGGSVDNGESFENVDIELV